MGRVRMVLMLALGLGACVRRIPERGLGHEDEESVECGARLEELTARAEEGDHGLFGPCTLAEEGCKLERRICAIAGRQPDRENLRRRCAVARDDCARIQRVCQHRPEW